LTKSKCRRWIAGEEGNAMLRVASNDDVRAELSVDLDEICREGARRMLAAALEAERDAYLAAFADDHDEDDHRLVVGNGRARARVIATGAGPIEVKAPRVNDKRVDEQTGERCRFRSAILAPWCRKSPKVSEVLPLMYLHGMSSGDFAPALGEFFGSDAGLSPSVITRLTTSWQENASGSPNAVWPASTTCMCGWTASISTSVSARNGCAAW
jgi:hypothetical protein